MKKLVLLAAIAAMPFFASAQELKFGYLNAMQVLYAMPEISDVEKQIADYSAQNRKMLEDMQAEAQKQYDLLQQMLQDATATDAKKKVQQETVETLAQRLQTTQVTIQQDMQQKQSQLLQPVQDKLQKAIDSVGKKNNFFMVFNLDSEAVVYKSEKAVDVTALVKKELGIKE
ncbi:MAG: OmpH family outer membrane protein [Prevotellaceae bacterium]|jgi:outer membrane protein|nr:OmpH family outer membrane protein [Prevotellaceae bacterium]